MFRTIFAIASIIVIATIQSMIYTPPVTDSVTVFSLISSNDTFYIDQLRYLSRSFQQFAPTHPLHVLVTDDVNPAIVSDLSTFTIPHVVPAYAEPKRHLTFARWIHQFTKFKLWSFYEYRHICYMDSDIAFFNDATVGSIVAECESSYTDNITQLCGFEQDCENDGYIGNNAFWGMRYMQASFFCLKPNATLFAELEHDLINPFLGGKFVYAGKSVFTEQDVMNLYFKNRIHYIDCAHKTSGFLTHKKSEAAWIEWEMVNGQY